jgi:hypothetical protein
MRLPSDKTVRSIAYNNRGIRSAHPSYIFFHIPSDLVVDSWASSVESRSTLDFLYVPDA